VQRVVVTTPDTHDAVAVLAALGLEATVTSAGVSAELPADDTEPERITAALVVAGVRVRGLQVTGATLEDRFVDLTGEGFDVAG
jgi:ABC-2 type transport system ATP-binding protein